MIYSILDTDLYKFSMSNPYFQLYRDAEGTFTFNDRNNEVYNKEFLEMLQVEFARLSHLKMTMEEYAKCMQWVRKNNIKIGRYCYIRPLLVSHLGKCTESFLEVFAPVVK